MANDLNQCNFIGRLGKDPDTKYSQSGDAMCNFSIAVGWKTKDKEGTEWVRVSTFGKLAEICSKFLQKGSMVFVSGRFTTRKWTNKDGVEQYTTEIRADQMQMLGGKPEEGQRQDRPAPQQDPEPRQSGGGFGDFDDDIPFANPYRGRIALVV